MKYACCVEYQTSAGLILSSSLATEKDRKRTRKSRNEDGAESCTYLFTTATITVFSEKLTALIDLNINRGSLLGSEQDVGQPRDIKSMYFSVFHAPILPGRQSPVVELCEKD